MALERLQTILLFRALQFPLKQIRNILDSPGFEPADALDQQIRLLELRREHLDRLIAYARQIQKTGVIPVDFTAFDTSEMDQYTAEVQAKWGQTDACRQFHQKNRGQTGTQRKADADAMMDIFRQMGAIRHLSPASSEAQALISALQAFITEHFYTCTRHILQDLGQMYIADDRMRQNIDRAGSPGTADFAHQAIKIYCS